MSSVMTQEQYEKVCPFIVVKDSAIDGRGVFATRKLTPQYLSPYPGEINHIPNIREHDSNYVLKLFGDWYADAKGVEKHHPHIGHLLNSSSPAAKAPFNLPTCVYLSVLVIQLDGSKSIKGAVWLNKTVQRGTELLCDYHWMLDSRSECLCSNALCIEERYRSNREQNIVDTFSTPLRQQVIASDNSSAKSQHQPDGYNRRRRVVTPIPDTLLNTPVSGRLTTLEPMTESVECTPDAAPVVTEASPSPYGAPAVRKILTPMSSVGMVTSPIALRTLRPRKKYNAPR